MIRDAPAASRAIYLSRIAVKDTVASNGHQAYNAAVQQIICPSRPSPNVHANMPARLGTRGNKGECAMQRYGYGYVRVSTDKQEELSPDSQEKLIREYGKKNNIIILKIYNEIGISGRSADKRPAFQEMVASAKSKEHPVDAILVWKYSRFARNQEESIVYKSLLKKQNNVDVISVSEPLVDGPFGSLIERIIEWMDEYYSIRLSGEVFRGMKENAMRGSFQARPPLGYRIAERGRPPVIVPDEADIIRTIFHKYANESMSFFDIARYLNSLGYKTTHNKPFERRSIEYIVQNPIYCGMIRWNRTQNATNEIKDRNEWIIVDGEQEPIISKELYEKAQERYKSTCNPKGSRPSSTYKHWLSGLIKCPVCGRTLTASTLHRKNGEPYSYFSCYGYSKGKCKKPNGVSSLVVEREVLQCFREVLDTGNIEYELKHYETTEIIDEQRVINERIKGLVHKEERIKASYREGIDTLEEYKEHKQLIQEERDRLTAQLKELYRTHAEKPEDISHALLQKAGNVYAILTSDRYPIAQKNDALKQIVDKIIYDRTTDMLKIYYFYYT